MSVKSFTEKSALAAGAAALAAVPAAADAALVTNTTGISISIFDVGAGTPGPGAQQIWDIDGDGNGELSLLAFGSGSDNPGTGTVVSYRIRNGALGWGGITYPSSAPLNGVAFAGGGNGSGEFFVQSSFTASPILPTAYATLSITQGSPPAPLMFGGGVAAVTTGGGLVPVSGAGSFYPIFPGGPFNVAFQFQIGGNDHYGWAEFEFNVPLLSFSINQWTYNDTPDAPVHVPDTAQPIPVPASIVPALTLLAGGAAGLRILRKRKEAAQEG